jgi:hypothetical protein
VRLRPITIALLLCLAIGLHFQNALVYRGEWQALREYFWQLTWRAPQLQPGTIIASDAIPLFRFSDNDLTPILNWTYVPQHHSRKIPFKYFDLSLRLGSTLPEVKEGLPIRHGYRNLMFTGSSSALLVVFNRPGTCLWVLRPGDRAFPGLPETVQDTLSLSNLKQIVTDASPAAQPPANLGAEPEHGWCYFFEKADLARQQRDWQKVVSLAETAQDLKLTPGDPLEWLPFIEGYAQLGLVTQAVQLSSQLGQQPDLHIALCATWKRLQKSLQLDPQEDNTLRTIYSQYNCTP